MSEIKGQLLGIILVIMVFGIVAASLTAIFTSLTETISSEVANIGEMTSSNLML